MCSSSRATASIASARQYYCAPTRAPCLDLSICPQACNLLKGASWSLVPDRAAPPAERLEPRERRGARQSPLVDTSRLPRRVTLMIGFWARDVASVIKRAPYTACGPTPRVSRACTWPRLLAHTSDGASGEEGAPDGGDGSSPCKKRKTDSSAPTRVSVPLVSPAWDVIPADRSAVLQPLKLDDVRNNQFFVQRMDDFVFEAPV